MTIYFSLVEVYGVANIWPHLTPKTSIHMFQPKKDVIIMLGELHIIKQLVKFFECQWNFHNWPVISQTYYSHSEGTSEIVFLLYFNPILTVPAF